MDSREIEKRMEKMEAAECPDYALLRRWAKHPDALIREQVAAVLVFGAGEPGRDFAEIGGGFGRIGARRGL